MFPGASLAVQWLGLFPSTAGGLGLISGLGTKTPQATQHRQKKKKEKNYYVSWLFSLI